MTDRPCKLPGWLRAAQFSDLSAALFCAGISVLAVLIARPFVEMGVNDDWAFAHMALVASRTWRLQYDGWTQPLVGCQAYWGAVFIKVFGFSFTLLRLSLLPFVAGAAVLQFCLARQTGLRRSFAVFAAMTVALSPAFLSVAPTFMTDSLGLFFLLATAFCSLRASAPDEAHPIWWMIAAAVAGFAGGTVRQILFAAPVTMLLAVAVLRRRRSVQLVSVGLVATIIAIAIWLMVWQFAQPNAVLGNQLAGVLPHDLRTLLREGLLWTLMILLTTALICLPVGIAFLTIKPSRQAALFVGVGLIGFLLLGHRRPLLLTAPWLGNSITIYGLLPPNLDVLGDKPVVIPPVGRLAIALIVALASLIWLTLLPGEWKRLFGGDARDAGGLRRLIAIFLPYSLCYLAFLVPRAFAGWAFDRYFVQLACGLIIVWLWTVQHRMRSVPLLSWVVLIVFAAWGIATEHDAFALARARLAAAEAALHAGSRRTCVSAGYEFDAWTQVETAGSIVHPLDPRYQQYVREHRTRLVDFWFLHSTPAVNPRHVVATSPQATLSESGLPPIVYHTWFPPHERAVYTQVDPTVPCPE